MAKKKKEFKESFKGQKVISRILLILLIFVALVFVGARLFFRIPVLEYYWSSDKAFAIPGLSDGLVPQGLDYIESENMLLIGGYQKDGGPSRVYRVDANTGKTSGYVVLGDTEGNGVAPHAGGLAVHGDYLFVAGDEDANLYIYNLSEVLNANKGDIVKMVCEFSTKFGDDEVKVACLCFAEDRLIVGEFYRVPNYVTPESHYFTTTTGETNHAIALCYRLSDAEGTVCGVETQPFEAYSLPELVQGIAIEDGQMWVSQSYGTAVSNVRRYNVTGSEQIASLTTDNGEIPVYSLDGNTLTGTYELPPMAEEIVFVDGKLLTMSESASNKYFFGKLTGGRWCYATDIEKFAKDSEG